MMAPALLAVTLRSALIADAHAETADRVLYVVADRIVTSSDVLLEAALSEHDRALLPFQDSASAEQRAVDMAILRERAGDAVIYRPSPSDVRARLDRLRAAHGSGWEAFLAAWGLDERRLEGILFSRMVVERYALRNAPRATDAAAAPEAGRPPSSTTSSPALDAWMAEQRAGVRVVAVAGR